MRPDKETCRRVDGFRVNSCPRCPTRPSQKWIDRARRNPVPILSPNRIEARVECRVARGGVKNGHVARHADVECSCQCISACAPVREIGGNDLTGSMDATIRPPGERRTPTPAKFAQRGIEFPLNRARARLNL